MKALITGASGFIGRHLTAELKRRHWELSVLAHNQPIPEENTYQVFQGDITDPESLSRIMEGVDTVFHLAAALGASLINKDSFYRINVEGTKNMLTAAQAAGVKNFIHFSSAGVLGAVKNEDIADEDYPCNPKNTYDLTKLEGERIVLKEGGDGLNIKVIRPGWVYGPGDRRTFKLIKAIADNRFFLVARGSTRQTPVYINDLIHGVLLCLEKGKNQEVYNLPGSEVLTVRQMVEIIAEAAEARIPRIRLPLLPTAGAAWTLEKIFRIFHKEAPLTMGKLAFFIHPKPLANNKASEELGYTAQIDFRDGMTLALAWYHQNSWL